MPLGDEHDNTPPTAKTPYGDVPNVEVDYAVIVNVNVAAELDGQSGVDVHNPGDTLLLLGQSTETQNGIYVAGSGAPATRDTSYDASADFASMFSVTVTGGANAGVYYFMPQASAFVLGTSDMNFIKEAPTAISLVS